LVLSKSFADALIAACSGTETVVAYNASFEVQGIDALIERFPALFRALKKLRKRVVDLLPIVRDHVYHRAFGGGFGLKAVLPALVPDLGYGDLEVQDGGTAATLLEALLLGGEAIPC
jgi:hypothetical protein